MRVCTGSLIDDERIIVEASAGSLNGRNIIVRLLGRRMTPLPARL